MNYFNGFNQHNDLKGKHAFLSPSNYHWLNYGIDKLRDTYRNSKAVELGTKLHDFACKAIELGIKQQAIPKTLNMYINDAIGYKMNPEQPLYFSRNCFGTADAIVFRRKQLRIHDLKTGTIPASMKQLHIYAALFCLEYDMKPESITFELRIYQNNECLIDNPDPAVIRATMDQIILCDSEIEKLRKEEGL